MKYILWVFLGFALLVGLYFFISYNSRPLLFPPKTSQKSPSPTRTIVQSSAQKLLFIPYWGLGTKSFPSGYDQYIYFGVTADTNGINEKEDGYQNIQAFLDRDHSSAQKLLTVRILDPEVADKLLKDKNFQNQIISQADTVATNDGFDGIVLDFEYNALAFDAVVKSITNFSKNFALQSKNHQLSFYQTIYGDTFYRLRPFDVAEMAKNADGLIVLAYDFHKATGDPGANFPLLGKDTQGYDFETMTQDFLNKIPSSKLIVAFGLFGYDWQVNALNQSSATATALSLMQIQQKFLNGCSTLQCDIRRDAESSETKITYTDTKGNSHIVWYEDFQSIQKKALYLHSQGINATALWAYSYF